MIFVDTSFWAAVRNPRDDRHQEAARLIARLEEETLVTTNQVRGETWTLMQARAGHAEAVRFLDRVEESSRVTVAWVDAEVEAEALSWLRRHDERAYSFVDATSFAMMRARGISEALAFDADFEAAGFVTLRA